ncbi:hypothetical protein [Paenibacillus eucommiae]|uniref:Cell division protein FtsI/penicillin-binding protein 2 n=1 Tax=Paenibacillus eucommiae TaxID=1355755 RepID=A0ABS4J8V8_9BACL|nr:hypothetical protein [Paenibacillus eucommiae]MBP1996276.1 cell division protein FtsI/penicillin-binding protein 2 [Paenibacillus eucommiae]
MTIKGWVSSDGMRNGMEINDKTKVRKKKFETLAISVLGSKDVSIPPIRGNIYDSAGQQIAYSISTQSLYFTFKTGFKQEAAEALAAKLVQLFNEKGEANSKPLTTEEVIEAMDIKGRAHPPPVQSRPGRSSIGRLYEQDEGSQGANGQRSCAVNHIISNGKFLLYNLSQVCKKRQ